VKSPHVCLTMTGIADKQSKTLISQKAFTLVLFSGSWWLPIRGSRGLRESVYSDTNHGFRSRVPHRG
jgi:hypothetical protein